jgi:lysophospholipase L1-like esterase
VIGDSKSVNQTWVSPFVNLVSNSTYQWSEAALRIAQVGTSVAVRKAAIDADLATRAATPAPEYICINLGTNDVNGDGSDVLSDGTGATWQSNLAYILDALHAKWASAEIYVMRPWKPDYDGGVYQAKLDLIGDTLIPAAITGRAWAHLGPDERVFLENGDDGATYIQPEPDRIHPNTAGYALTAAQWRTTLGM